jgi:hypothetical protein
MPDRRTKLKLRQAKSTVPRTKPAGRAGPTRHQFMTAFISLIVVDGPGRVDILKRSDWRPESDSAGLADDAMPVLTTEPAPAAVVFSALPRSFLTGTNIPTFQYLILDSQLTTS